MVTMPKIEILFKQLATSLVERSERGIGILIVRDDTSKFDVKMYSSIDAVETSDYTADNVQAIRDVFNYALNKVYVVRIDAEASVSAALTLISKNIKTGWITIANGKSADFTAISSWIKTQELNGKSYKAVVYKANSPDCRHIVNFMNEKVNYADERGEKDGSAYLPSLMGIFASCNITRGATNYKCADLSAVLEVANNDTAVGNGQLILVNDTDCVRIATAINSLTTTNGSTLTEDMKYIDVIEAMDLIADDIGETFKNEYLGNYRNNYNNQVLLISSIQAYLKNLAEDDILDKNYNNTVDVDVEAQRNAWLGTGKTEAADWSDQEVKNNAFKRNVFLKGDIKILGSMDNLRFNVELF